MMMHLHQLCMVAIIELQTLHKKSQVAESNKKNLTFLSGSFPFILYHFGFGLDYVLCHITKVILTGTIACLSFA